MRPSGFEKAITIFAAGLIGIAAFTVLVNKTSKTKTVLTGLGSATSSSLSAAEGRG